MSTNASAIHNQTKSTVPTKNTDTNTNTNTNINTNNNNNKSFVQLAKQTSSQWQVKTIGTQRLTRFLDLMFMVENKDKKFLQPHKKYIQNINIRIYGALTIFPIAAALNFIIQKKIPSIFGGLNARGMIFDLFWYIGATYLFLVITQLNTKQQKFKQVKNQLIKNKQAEYLLFLNQNQNKYKIGLYHLLGDKNINQSQLALVQFYIHQAVNNGNKKSNSIL